MSDYVMVGAEDQRPGDAEKIYATHSAQPGTFVIYANEGEDPIKVTVVLWGVLDDGTAVPITLSGVWDGSANRDKFVLFPDGRCGDFDTSWDSLEQALSSFKKEAAA